MKQRAAIPFASLTIALCVALPSSSQEPAASPPQQAAPAVAKVEIPEEVGLYYATDFATRRMPSCSLLGTKEAAESFVVPAGKAVFLAVYRTIDQSHPSARLVASLSNTGLSKGDGKTKVEFVAQPAEGQTEVYRLTVDALEPDWYSFVTLYKDKKNAKQFTAVINCFVVR